MNNKKSEIIKAIRELIETGVMSVYYTRDQEFYGIIRNGDETITCLINDSKFFNTFRELMLDKCSIAVPKGYRDYVIEYLEVCAFANKTKRKLAKRVYVDKETDSLYYDLTYDKAVVLEEGNAGIVELGELLFKRTTNYACQIEPCLDAEPEDLFPLVKKHFNFKRESSYVLFMLYLVSIFSGLDFGGHPLLVLVGEKGSSKSTCLRKLERIVDPKVSNITSGQIKLEDLQLKLCNDYFLTLDNLSRINRATSDSICVAISGGSITRRKLYCNDEMLNLDLKTIVAINSVNSVVTQSDLLDRSLLMELERIKPEDRKTEVEIWEEFEEDLPHILGAIFNTLALARNDKEEIEENTSFVRLADFHLLCIKIGKILGYEQSVVDKLLFQNQREVDYESLMAKPVAQCLLFLMEDMNEYVGAVNELLEELRQVACEIGIDPRGLPSQPNLLSHSLSQIKSNLMSFGIFYDIKKRKNYKEIRVTKKVE